LRVIRVLKWVMMSLILAFTGGAMAAEEPDFQVTLQQGMFEVREYPPLVAAEIRLQGDRNQTGNQGFRALAGYIFGGNTRRQKISMTAPVVQVPASGEKIPMTAPVIQTGAGDVWTVRFIMPKGFTLETLPVPDDPRVQLRAMPPERMAVVRFSGLAHDADVTRNTADLKAFMESHRLLPAGPAILARYNPPWTPWFMRRNEVMVPLRRE
jgi:SOUL heme-binding protein